MVTEPDSTPSIAGHTITGGSTARSPKHARIDTALTSAAGVAASNSTGNVVAKASSPSRKQLLTCDYPNCGRTFAKMGKLNRHKVSHTGEVHTML